MRTQGERQRRVESGKGRERKRDREKLLHAGCPEQGLLAKGK